MNRAPNDNTTIYQNFIFHRCVDEEDKSLSIGVTETLLSLFAFIPAPILYGVIMGKLIWIWYFKQKEDKMNSVT